MIRQNTLQQMPLLRNTPKHDELEYIWGEEAA